MGHLVDIGVRSLGAGAEPTLVHAHQGEATRRDKGPGRAYPMGASDDFGKALPAAQGAFQEPMSLEELEQLVPRGAFVELADEEETKPVPKPGAPRSQLLTLQDVKLRPGRQAKETSPQLVGTEALEKTAEEPFEAQLLDAPGMLSRSLGAEVTRRTGRARGEELAQHLAEDLRGLGLQVRLSQMPRAERARQLWSLFLDYARAASSKEPPPRPLLEAFEQVLTRHGFRALYDPRSGLDGVAAALWVLQARSAEQVRQRGAAVQLELLPGPLAATWREGLSLLPPWLRQLGERLGPQVLAWALELRSALAQHLPSQGRLEATALRVPAALEQVWGARHAVSARAQEQLLPLAEALRGLLLRAQPLQLLATERALPLLHAWATSARAALEQALPLRPMPAAVPPRAPARAVELPLAQIAAEAGVEAVAQQLAMSLKRLDSQAQRSQLPRLEGAQRLWSALLDHAQVAASHAASPRRLRESFEPVLARYGFEELRDAGSGRNGVAAALWVLMGGTPEQVYERGMKVQLELHASAPPAPPETAATLPEFALIGRGEDGGGPRGAESVRPPGVGLPGSLPLAQPLQGLDPGLQLRSPRTAEHESGPGRRGLRWLPRRPGLEPLWEVLENLRAPRGKGVVELSELNRRIFVAVMVLLGLWVALLLLLSL